MIEKDSLSDIERTLLREVDELVERVGKARPEVTFVTGVNHGSELRIGDLYIDRNSFIGGSDSSPYTSLEACIFYRQRPVFTVRRQVTEQRPGGVYTIDGTAEGEFVGAVHSLWQVYVPQNNREPMKPAPPAIVK
jgi:hypothetical protein